MHDLAQGLNCDVKVVHGTWVRQLNKLIDDLNNVRLSTWLYWSKESFSDWVSATKHFIVMVLEGHMDDMIGVFLVDDDTDEAWFFDNQVNDLSFAL